MQEELQASLSQAYLSQLEKGKRVHLTASSRDLLATFFKVHPGYLVSDPPDYSTDLLTDMAEDSDRLANWLAAQTTEWATEPVVQNFFEHLASIPDPRCYLALFDQLIYLPINVLEEFVRTLNPHNENGAD
jgi:transcriptional regulator with XRE-family HTH domain